MNNNLYVITPIFNPFGFQSRYRLYRQFAKHMAESGAKLFTVEAAFGDRPYVVTKHDNPMNLQLRTNQILWHKERLINLAARKLFHHVPDARFIGWFDSDITFLNYDWVDESTHLLTHLSVIQPFSSTIFLDTHGEYMWHCKSTNRHFIESRGYHQEPPLSPAYTFQGHPGLAWCATRQAFEGMGGLYDACVSGSGDTVISNSLKGDWSAYLPDHASEGMKRHMAAWANRAMPVVRGRIGYTKGTVAHHWHGASEKRGYEKRWSILSFHNFDPDTDIVAAEGELYSWAGNKPRLEDDIRLSLGNRNEDS